MPTNLSRRILIVSNKRSIKAVRKHSITIIGAGNVANHISRHFHASGLKIDAIWSRSAGKAEQLARELECDWSTEQEKLPVNSSFYLLAVSDNSVAELATMFKGRRGIWLHCAGALTMKVLEQSFARFGVMYPLQTITAERKLSFQEVPIIIEGSDSDTTEEIRSLAELLSERVMTLDSSKRLILHLAAVFANNFSNHMIGISHAILELNQMDPSLLDPILKETFLKAIDLGPSNAQTGPAVRKDRLTMEKHLELLKAYPEWEKMYTFMSQEIQKFRE